MNWKDNIARVFSFQFTKAEIMCTLASRINSKRLMLVQVPINFFTRGKISRDCFWLTEQENSSSSTLITPANYYDSRQILEIQFSGLHEVMKMPERHFNELFCESGLCHGENGV